MFISFIFKFSESYSSLLNNGKIIIKDLRESRLYHELINEIEKKEEMKEERYKNEKHNCSLHDLEKNKKGDYYKFIKNN